MKKINRIVILIALFFQGCRKKDFPVSETTPVSDFYFTATIDGTSINLKAGANNYYMYTSYALDHDSLYRFIAELKPNNCVSCKNSLQISINDYKFSTPNSSVYIDSALSAKPYPILSSPAYAVQFKSIFNQQAKAYLWNFGDNQTSTEANPLHIYTSAGNYSVSLRIDATNSCQQYISNTEKIQVPASNVNIIPTNIGVNALSFVASTLGSLQGNYFWDFGDGYTSISLAPTHTYAVAGTYPVTLRVRGTTLDTIVSRCNVATLTNPMPCLSNYSISSVNQVVAKSLFSKVVITWTDDNGDVFTSQDLHQPANSNFRIISVNDYEANEKGEKTKMIKVSFSCNVYNGTRVKRIENAESVLGVAYK